MAPDTNDSADSTRLGRRKYLALGALATTGLAGCAGEDTTAETSTATGTATETPSAQSPKELSRTFYKTLYGEDDIEGANALYHPESPSPPLEASGFEPYGGLENIHTDVQSVTVVSKGDGRATVHATVEYTLPDTTNTATDYMYLRQAGQQWRINGWLPEAPRRQRATATVAQFYDALYTQNDVEAANEMYHDSPGPLEAASFEPYGGLENIDTTVTSTEIVTEGDGKAEVHADVEYTTPNGTITRTDYVFLTLQRGNWKIDSWLPEAVRHQQATATVAEFYETLYNQNDIEAANEMYHDSPGPLEASSFEPYGGLEKIETTVTSTEIVSEGDGEAEIHADIEYTTPNGTNTMTDYVFLKSQRGSWKIDRWVPQAVREQNTTDGG